MEKRQTLPMTYFIDEMCFLCYFWPTHAIQVLSTEHDWNGISTIDLNNYHIEQSLHIVLCYTIVKCMLFFTSRPLKMYNKCMSILRRFLEKQLLGPKRRRLHSTWQQEGDDDVPQELFPGDRPSNITRLKPLAALPLLFLCKLSVALSVPTTDALSRATCESL